MENGPGAIRGSSLFYHRPLIRICNAKLTVPVRYLPLEELREHEAVVADPLPLFSLMLLPSIRSAEVVDRGRAGGLTGLRGWQEGWDMTVSFWLPSLST